ncbi:MAG: MMPL family transporter [Tenericutes bacterium]|nr:MMPL family transporter [Mycoplasmatota bacterium]
MKKISKFIINNKTKVLIISCILLVLSFIGMKLTTINYNILVYLPSEIDTIKGQDILTDEFNMGSYSIVVAEKLSPKEILNLKNKITKVEGVNEVLSIYDVLGTNIPIDVLPSEIKDKIHQDNTDLMFITFKYSTSDERTINAVEEIRNITDHKLMQGGMSSMVLDTMNLSNEEITIYVIIAVALCLIVLELSLDSYVVPVLLLANIGMAIMFNFGTNVFLGDISYITKALVAVLQLGVTTDYSIFLYHAYEDKKEKMSKEEAMEEAISETFTSVVGSSLTTIAGFLVLCTMKLTLGTDLGIVMAKGVLLGIISVLTIFPSLLLFFDKQVTKTKHRKLMPNFNKINTFIVNNNKAFFVIFIILLIPLYLANNKVEVYYKLDRSLPRYLESVKTNELLKEKYNIVSPQIILVDKNLKIDDLTNLTNELSSLKGIDLTLSTTKLSEYGLSDNMINLFDSDKYNLILINSKYDVATNELNNQIEEINKIVKKYDQNGIVAGEGALMKDLVTICDTDFKNVNYSSILCIFLILFIILKNFSLPFLLIIAIEGAIFANMSISYFTGSVLPFIAPIVLGTIQLGATIDYAILITTTYVNNRKTNKSKKECMINTLNYCGHSVLVSAACFFAATFGVGVYSKIEMIGSICNLISRGALISMLFVLTILPSILLIFDNIINKTNMKGNKMKKLNLAVLTVAMLSPLCVFANTKNETVYSKIDEKGNIISTTVNEQIKNNKKLDTIEDYTELEDILNISSNDEITKLNKNISINAFGKDVFYQGTSKKSLPIGINIKYYLDGKEESLDNILGKSGKIKIVIDFTNNEKHNALVNGKQETMYTPFLITMGTMLDSNVTNIKINNGKVVASGNKNMVVGISSPYLNRSLNINELSTLNTLTLSYETDNFKLPTMYFVATNKLLSDADLSVFNKLDGLNSKVDELQTNMNKIDNGASDLSKGINKLKNSLSSSITNLKNNNEDALDEKTLVGIRTQTMQTVQNTFTNDYKKKLSESAWIKVEENLKNSNDTYVTDLATKTVSKILLSYLGSEEALNNYMLCVSGNMESCAYLIQNNYDINKINAFALTLKQEITSLTTNTTNYIAENVSKSVASTVAEETAISTAESIVNTLAPTLSNQVKNESIKSFTSSLNTLYTNIDYIDSNMNTLSTGITTFNKEGIEEISALVNGPIASSKARVKALSKLADNYTSYASKSTSINDETKFIIVLDGKEKQEEKTNITEESSKTNLWTRIKNLFK